MGQVNEIPARYTFIKKINWFLLPIINILRQAQSRKNFTKKQHKIFQEAFDFFDRDQDGQVNALIDSETVENILWHFEHFR